MDGSEPRRAGAIADVAQLEAARLGLHRAEPQRSAKRSFHFTQLVAIVVLGLGLYATVRAEPTLSLNVLHALAWALFLLAILWRLFAAASLRPPISRIATPARWPSYTILCPVYREANVIADLIAALDRLEYPRTALQIIVLVEADDAETMSALVIADAPHIEIVRIPPASPRTKPKALNIGLARARGEYLVVYDAEDRPHPHQLPVALAAFEDGGDRLACVQAPLQIDNADASWIAGQFAAEYAIQFREVLPLLARCGLPLPLGGSSNHFRTAALRAVGGWDAYNVTEDADLGYRLACKGYSANVIWAPTGEEAPVTFAAWRKQRTRWIKGHMQTWLVLMRNPLRTVREMGLTAFLSMQLMLGGGIIASFAHGPLSFFLLAAAFTPYDLSPADFILAIFGYSVAVFAAMTASVLSQDLRHIRAAATMPLYWPLASIAAFGALFGLIFRPHHWAKTQHGVSPRPRIVEAQEDAQRSDRSSTARESTSASG